MIGRQLLNICWLIFAILISGCASQPQSNYDALVDPTKKPAENVFSSIQSALDAAPVNSSSPYIIFLAEGDYYEKINISKPNIHLLGENTNTTRIYYDAYAGKNYAEGKTWGTPGSATVTIRATDIQIRQLTIENTFDFLSNDALANDDAKRVANSQAVALFLDAGSDKFLARDVRLLPVAERHLEHDSEHPCRFDSERKPEPIADNV